MSRADRLWLVLFYWVTERARTVVAAGLLLIAVCGTGLFSLVKETSADALVDRANPARQYKDRVAEVFGLTDPVVLAVTVPMDETIYRADVLEIVEQLSARLATFDNVDPERVVSLATQKRIAAGDDGIEVHPLLQRPDGGRASPREVADAIAAMPLYQGGLVARDGSATLIVANLLEAQQASDTYQQVVAMAASERLPQGVTLHVAGDGAVSGYLSHYIDQDAFRLTPLATLIIGIVLLMAFRTLSGAILPTLVIGGTLTGAVGLMALTSTPFYVITNGLLVNLVGISVADSIHVLAAHRRMAAAHGHETRQQVMCRTMLEMWRPITLTTLTTTAGFAALAFATDMAPVTAFGGFGAVGVILAWMYTMTLLPAAAMLLPTLPGERGVIRERSAPDAPADSPTAKAPLARWVQERPRTTVLISAGLVILGVGGASRVEVNDAWIDNFDRSEPLHVADQLINQRTDGVNYIDVVIESSEVEGLLQPAALQRIESLQAFLLTLPHVNGTTSVLDYIKQMHQALQDGDPDAYTIPDDADTVAQLLLLYGLSSDPTDLEEEIDSLHQSALLRVALDRSVYRNNDIIVPELRRYLREEFNTPTLTGTATGRVVVDYTWVRSIADSHLRSLGLALLAVLAVCLVVFRSLADALLAMIPVAVAVLTVYCVMGLTGIALGVGTSMFAAIAIGLGVDFSIHALLRLKGAFAEHGDIDRAVAELYPATGWALFFNFVAVSLGFGVLILSSTPPLRVFGLLVVAAIASAYAASVTTLPAIFKLRHGRLRNRASVYPAPGVRPLEQS